MFDAAMIRVTPSAVALFCLQVFLLSIAKKVNGGLDPSWAYDESQYFRRSFHASMKLC
jgi:hypothetical protein